MLEDGQVIGPDENVLRRVPVSQVKLGALIPITRGAFTPTPSDTDGLSFYLEREVDIAQLKEIARKPADQYVVVRLSVRDLNDAGLQVIAKKADNLPGHCLVPDFNYQSYSDKTEKTEKWIPVQEALRRKAEIVG